MSAGHTPGPWEMRGGSLHRRHWLIDAPHARFIAQIDGPPDEMGEANARLIAAAPDLLAAAKAVAASGRRNDIHHGAIVGGDALDALDAAIAKATGQ